MDRGTRIAVIFAVVVIAGGGLLVWRHLKKGRAPAVPVLTRPVTAQPAVAPQVAAPTVAEPAAAPPVKHPLTTSGGDALPPFDQSDDFVKKLVSGLLGGRHVLPFLVNDDLARRFVATVDNLARDDAPSSRWPVVPTPGRFQTDAAGDATVIAAANAERYAPFVKLVASADATAVARLYRRLYPLFQHAYEELGYPNRYFNDRVVEVIDDLLRTPDVPEPIAVKRAAVPGQTPSPGPGGLYLFADPTLESRTAGQKLLLRMGHANAATVKAKLAEIRRLLVG